MNQTIIVSYLLAMSLFLASCTNDSSSSQPTSADELQKGTYAFDLAFLKKHTREIVELSSEDGQSKILLSADYQGRVMTSTAQGDSGSSFGWINYELLRSGEKKKQFNPVGGEERFWMGPEGGQYSIYFKEKDSFAFANWQVPAIIDTISYTISHSDKSEVVFSQQTTLTNYSGTVFNIEIERTIKLLDKTGAERKLKTAVPEGIRFVGYETENKIQNTGATDWTQDKGLVSIWLLGMFTPSPKTVVIIPFSIPKKEDLPAALVAAAITPAKHFITDNYFGEIPADRLQVKDSILYFTCDGKYRSKIGLSPIIAKPIAGSFDFEKNILTIVVPQVNCKASYVNSKWEIQKEPYKGDVINSYNDGPLSDGSQMGPFYEIESSSPALQLRKGETGEYRQATFHFQGDYDALKQLAKQLLGVDLAEIKK